MEFKKYRTNATARHFKNMTKVIYLITAQNFWSQDHNIPHIFVKIYKIKLVSKVVEAMVLTLTITSIFARYTQDNLTEKQNTDVLMKSVCIINVYVIYVATVYRKGTIIELLFSLTVTLKGFYDNETVERKMIKKTWMYLAGLVVSGSSVTLMVGVDGAAHALTSNATFTTVIPIWPNIEDRSLFAGFARILIYMTWLILVARNVSINVLIVCISICLGYQFEDLYEYFLSLNDIFEGEGSQEEKETKYEEAVKVGIKMHNITLNCVHQLQSSCSVAYSCQVLMNVGALMLLLIQMMQSERTLGAMAPPMIVAAGILLFSGFYTWSAGDITFQAERLPTAMFHSGWHNCRRQSSVRVRKMITIAMAQAQQVVVIKALFIIEMSYESFIKIVKSSYSIFSVIY